jgi:hypothetical protein
MNINPDKINLHCFAAAILHHLKDQEVELYCGDVRTTRLFADYERAQKNVLRCVIKDALGDCLIVECNKRQGSATVFVNVWAIKAIVRVNDPLFISDIFEDEEQLQLEKRRQQ